MVALQSVIDRLDGYDSEATIFAATPWTPESDCIVIKPSSDKVDAPEAKGLPYFLEISIAQELKADLGTMSPEAICRRIIEYAVNDA